MRDSLPQAMFLSQKHEIELSGCLRQRYGTNFLLTAKVAAKDAVNKNRGECSPSRLSETKMNISSIGGFLVGKKISCKSRRATGGAVTNSTASAQCD
jgi:hypothetical protein